jgi:hypothetical protein
MAASLEITDEKGYHARKDEIDATILALLAEGGKTSQEIGVALRKLGIGNARSDDRLEIAYSMTGAVQRSATNNLRKRGLITDSWDKANYNRANFEPPFRFFKVGV